MVRQHALPVVLVAVVLFAGCFGGGGPAISDETTEPPTTTTPQPETTTTQTTTTEQRRPRVTREYPYGTEFLSVDRLGNQSRGNTSKEGFVAFGNLTDREQAVFEQALEADITFRPDDGKINPFGFNDRERPEYVRYEGTWYYVQVAIV